MKECIIIGAGKYGQVYSEYLKQNFNVIAFYDDNLSLHGKFINKILVKGSVEDATKLENNISVFIPIGNNIVRYQLIKKFKQAGFKLPSFIHSSVSIHSTVKLGKPVYMLPNCNIMPFSSVKEGGMLSVGVNISHHTHIGNACFFSQGVNIGASILIEDYTYVGMAATIMTGVEQVGKNVLIGAGSVVIRNIQSNIVVAGVPAKYLRDR